MWHPTICVVFLVLMHESGKGFVLAADEKSTTETPPDDGLGARNIKSLKITLDDDDFTTGTVHEFCKDKPKIRPCRSGQESDENRYFFNEETNDCETYQGGCAGDTTNNFKSAKECFEVCKEGKTPESSTGTGDDSSETTPTKGTRGTIPEACIKGPKHVPCNAQGNRPKESFIFYNERSGYCDMFEGCAEETENHFKTKQECYDFCLGGKTRGTSGTTETMANTFPEKCYLQRDSGPCKAAQKKFFFHPMTKTCKEFGYGGCGGNENRFNTKEQCIRECLGNDATVDATETTRNLKTVIFTGFNDYGKRTTRILFFQPSRRMVHMPSAGPSQTITRPLD